MIEEPAFPANAFAKQDGSDDADFYAAPRFVTHIDDGAIAALTSFYRRALTEGAVILDLMSSWISHLPEDVPFADVIGHGMNADELRNNPRFQRWFVQDLNRDVHLPLAAQSVDAVLIAVSIQYLEKPIAVLKECARVLRPGGRIIISFSNRCFPTKAVAIWLALGHEDHARLIELYLEHAGFDGIATHILCDGVAGDPLIALSARITQS